MKDFNVSGMEGAGTLLYPLEADVDDAGRQHVDSAHSCDLINTSFCYNSDKIDIESLRIVSHRLRWACTHTNKLGCGLVMMASKPCLTTLAKALV